MQGIELFPDDAPGTVRPAWQVIEAARRQHVTGVLTLAAEPPARVYLRAGEVYLAERAADPALGMRLLAEGVVTREQLRRGALVVNGVEHLGRLFEREPTVDRDAVELCVEMFTDRVLAAVAPQPVRSYSVAVYERHPSGVDRWLPTSTVHRHVPAPPAPDESVVAAPAVAAPAVPEPVAPEPVAAASAVAWPAVTWQDGLSPSPVTSTVTAPAPEPAPAFDLEGLASGTIADEVADAVRRALAAIEHAAQPLPRIDPDDVVGSFEASGVLPSTSVPA
jgi:hypothetical protein